MNLGHIAGKWGPTDLWQISFKFDWHPPLRRQKGEQMILECLPYVLHQSFHFLSRVFPGGLSQPFDPLDSSYNSSYGLKRRRTCCSKMNLHSLCVFAVIYVWFSMHITSQLTTWIRNIAQVVDWKGRKSVPTNYEFAVLPAFALRTFRPSEHKYRKTRTT